jgi:hypothetical protein
VLVVRRFRHAVVDDGLKELILDGVDRVGIRAVVVRPGLEDGEVAAVLASLSRREVSSRSEGKEERETHLLLVILILPLRSLLEATFFLVLLRLFFVIKVLHCLAEMAAAAEEVVSLAGAVVVNSEDRTKLEVEEGQRKCRGKIKSRKVGTRLEGARIRKTHLFWRKSIPFFRRSAGVFALRVGRVVSRGRTRAERGDAP